MARTKKEIAEDQRRFAIEQAQASNEVSTEVTTPENEVPVPEAMPTSMPHVNVPPPRPVVADKKILPSTMETHITQTVSPGVEGAVGGDEYDGGNGNGNGSGRAPRTFAERLNHAYEHGEMLSVEIYQTDPWGLVHSFPEPLPYEALRAQLPGLIGGGKFRARLKDGEGRPIPRGKGGECELNLPTSQFPARTSAAPASSVPDPVRDLAMRTQQAKQERELRKAEAELKKMEEEQEEQDAVKRERREDARGKRGGEVEALRAEMRAMQERADAKFERLMDKLATQPPPPQLNLGEIMTAVAGMVAALKPPAPPAPVDSLAPVKEIMTMLIEKQVNAPTTQEQIAQAEERAEKRAERQFKMLMDVTTQRHEFERERMERELEATEEQDIDPNNITGSLFAQGLKGLIWMFRNGGPQVIQALSQMAQKPPGAMTDADLAQLYAQQQQRAHVPAALPGPLPDAPPRMADFSGGGGAPRHVATPRGNPRPPSTGDVRPPPPLPVAAASTPDAIPAQTQQPLSAPAENAPVSEATASITPAETGAVNEVEEDQQFWIDEAMKEAVIDLTAERPEHSWIETAAAKWHKSFLRQLLATTDNTEIIPLIQSKTSPALWAQIDVLMKVGGNAYNFLLNLGKLREWAVTNIDKPAQDVAPIVQPSAPADAPMTQEP